MEFICKVWASEVQFTPGSEAPKVQFWANLGPFRGQPARCVWA